METAAVSEVCPWLLPPPVAAQCVAAVSVTVYVVVPVQQGFGFVEESAVGVQG